MLEVLIRSFSYVVMIVLGYVLKKTGRLPKTAFQTVSTIVMTLTLPCAVVANFGSVEFDNSLLFLTLLGLLLNGLHILVGYAAGRKKSGSEKAFEVVNHSGYNIGCFSTPFVQNFLGSAGTLATYTFDAGNAIVCTGALYPIAAAAMKNGEKFTLSLFLRRMFSSAPLCAYLGMLILSVLKVRLPSPVITFASMVGGANAFLAMLMIGLRFEIHLKKSEFSTIFRILLTRYVMAALLALFFYFITPFPLMVRQMLALMVFSPLPAISLVFTEKTGGKVEMAGTLSSLMILVSIFCMTVLMMLMC